MDELYQPQYQIILLHSILFRIYLSNCKSQLQISNEVQYENAHPVIFELFILTITQWRRVCCNGGLRCSAGPGFCSIVCLKKSREAEYRLYRLNRIMTFEKVCIISALNQLIQLMIKTLSLRESHRSTELKKKRTQICMQKQQITKIVKSTGSGFNFKFRDLVQFAIYQLLSNLNNTNALQMQISNLNFKQINFKFYYIKLYYNIFLGIHVITHNHDWFRYQLQQKNIIMNIIIYFQGEDDQSLHPNDENDLELITSKFFFNGGGLNVHSVNAVNNLISQYGQRVQIVSLSFEQQQQSIKQLIEYSLPIFTYEDEFADDYLLYRGHQLLLLDKSVKQSCKNNKLYKLTKIKNITIIYINGSFKQQFKLSKQELQQTVQEFIQYCRKFIQYDQNGEYYLYDYLEDQILEMDKPVAHYSQNYDEFVLYKYRKIKLTDIELKNEPKIIDHKYLKYTVHQFIHQRIQLGPDEDIYEYKLYEIPESMPLNRNLSLDEALKDNNAYIIIRQQITDNIVQQFIDGYAEMSEQILSNIVQSEQCQTLNYLNSKSQTCTNVFDKIHLQYYSQKLLLLKIGYTIPSTLGWTLSIAARRPLIMASQEILVKSGILFKQFVNGEIRWKTFLLRMIKVWLSGILQILVTYLLTALKYLINRVPTFFNKIFAYLKNHGDDLIKFFEKYLGATNFLCKIWRSLYSLFEALCNFGKSIMNWGTQCIQQLCAQVENLFDFLCHTLNQLGMLISEVMKRKAINKFINFFKKLYDYGCHVLRQFYEFIDEIFENWVNRQDIQELPNFMKIYRDSLVMLGLAENCTREQIKVTTNYLLGHYHPDRVLDQTTDVIQLYEQKCYDIFKAQQIIKLKHGLE